MINWIFENKEWLFSGVLVAIIGFALNLLYKKYFEKESNAEIVNSENNAIIRGSNHRVIQKSKEGQKNSLDLEGDNIQMEQSPQD